MFEMLNILNFDYVKKKNPGITEYSIQTVKA